MKPIKIRLGFDKGNNALAIEVVKSIRRVLCTLILAVAFYATSSHASLVSEDPEGVHSGAAAPCTVNTERADDPRPQFPVDAFDDRRRFVESVKEWERLDTEWVKRQLR